MSELERAYETINQIEDLLGCALAHLDGDPAYGNKDAIKGYLQAYFDARKEARCALNALWEVFRDTEAGDGWNWCVRVPGREPILGLDEKLARRIVEDHNARRGDDSAPHKVD